LVSSLVITSRKRFNSTTAWIRHYIQNIPYWYRHLYSCCGTEKHRPQKVKLWIPGSTAKFCGDCVKMCQDVAPNFDENRPRCFTMTTHPLTLPSSPSSFWQNTKWLSSPNHRAPLIWHPVTSSYFQKWIEAKRTPVWYHWRDPGRIAESVWHCDRKGLPGSVRKMDETVEPVSTCGRELLGWW
jgi:hypothetical protein